MPDTRADLLVIGASQVVTVAAPPGVPSGPRRGGAMREVGAIPGGAVAAFRGRIVAVGEEAEVRRRVDLEPGATVVDAAGGTVLPGLLDPHTHALFAGWRADEFRLRLRGVPYLEILAAGGGILSTVQATRAAPAEELARLLQGRLRSMLLSGVTTVEVKSGYGLSWPDEHRLLSAMARVAQTQPIEIVPTFLGAHAVPPEYRGNADGYVEHIVRVMLPEVARQGLARFVDVFCDEGVFSLEQSRRILSAARRLGLGVRLHADELAPLGGAELAAELGAASADHLLRSCPEGWKRMAQAGVVAVLLPGTALFLGKPYAPARDMIRVGVAVALATDFNPGTCPIASLPLVMGLACVGMGMEPEEVVVAVTANAARAVGRGDDLGSLEEGKQADLAVFDVPGYEHIPYRMGGAPVTWVVKRGRVVVERGRPVDPAGG
ncbi:MAG: imidazolonepropionase [Bacillota bacterium]|nr:imidazolonepropionase [Bacillota bacterium]